MKKRSVILLVGAIAIATAAGFITRSSWMGGSSNAQGPQRPRMVSVELAKAERKSMPVDVDAIGMVTPISSVALKSRLETTIVAVHFEDGAKVNEGDLLFTLDSRQIDAQIEQAEGVLAKDQAQLEGAQRDLRRFNDLVGKGASVFRNRVGELAAAVGMEWSAVSQARRTGGGGQALGSVMAIGRAHLPGLGGGTMPAPRRCDSAPSPLLAADDRRFRPVVRRRCRILVAGRGRHGVRAAYWRSLGDR